jgi:16S rRNA processing protein RimM
MKRIPLGRVVSTHGIKGEVKFKYYNEVDEDIYKYTSFSARKGSREIILNPAAINPHKGHFRMRFQGLDSIEEVSFLVNQELTVGEDDLPEPDENEYYEYRLLGLDVLDEKDGKIGTVGRIMHTKGNDILVVTGEKEMFVPMTEEYILAVDLKSSYIKIRLEEVPQ